MANEHNPTYYCNSALLTKVSLERAKEPERFVVVSLCNIIVIDDDSSVLAVGGVVHAKKKRRVMKTNPFGEWELGMRRS